MRNLKRALSLTLASVMLLGMMVVGSSAAKGYPDVDEDSDNIEAIEVLQAVEVMRGDDKGNFNPNDPVTRSEMAVVMALLLNLNYEYYEATCPFWDVPTWARGYVGACYANGIVSGYGDGTYGAADGVTAVQAASMMMRALGYFQYAEDYNGGFELATVSKGTDIGIFKGLSAKSNEPLTRNDVARMALNALESEMVTFTGNPGTTYTASSGETLSIGYRAEYTPRTSTETKYQAIEQRTSDVSGGNNLNRGQYYIQLGEELYDGKLTKKYDTDDFERPSINWQYNGKEIGVYVDYDLLVAGGTFTSAVKYSELYNLLTFTTINDNSLYLYVDGVDQKVSKDNFSRSNKDEVGGTGVLTEVFYNQDREEIVITSINTYLAKANSDYNKTNETLSLKVYETNGTGTTKIVDSEDVANAADVAKDEYRLVYMSGKNNAAKLEVVRIFDVEIMTDTAITKWSKHDTKVVDKLTTEGTEYKTNPKAYYDKNGDVLLAYNEQRLTDTSYNIFLDRYGNVIGVDLYEGAKNYVFITGYDRINSNISVKTADAAAIFMDGTMQVITVNVTDTDKNIRKTNSDNYIEWGHYSYEGCRDLNRWYTYTVASNGNYTLKPVDRFFYTSYEADDFDTKGVMVLNTANLYLNDSNKTAGYDNKGRIYGNDDSVYITVEPGYVDTSKPTGSHDAITDVKGVYTGAQDVKLEITTTSKELVNERKGESHATSVYPNDAVDYSKVDYTTWNAPDEQNAYVYSVYDSNYYIIASVVLGDAQGATANYAYILGDAKSEWVEHDSSSRSTSDDTYFWEFEAVLNGEKQTLTVKSKYEDTIDDLKPYHVQELRFDGDYVTAIKDVDQTKIMDENDNTKMKADEYDVYDVGHVDADLAASDAAINYPASEKVHTGHSNKIDWTGHYDYSSRIHGTIELVGRTLYTERPYDVGLALTSDAKAVLIQKENKSVETIQCDSVAEAIGRLADADTRDVPEADGIQFHGRIVAVLDSAGAAKWVVIISDTLLLTGNQPSYGDTSDLRWVQYNEITGTGRYWELYIPGYVDATTVSSETIRNALASNGCSDISRNGSNWNFYRNGTRYENQVVRVRTTHWDDDKAYTLTIDPTITNGEVSAIRDGNKVTLTVKADANYKLATLNITGLGNVAADVKADDTYAFTLTRNTTVTATFTKIDPENNVFVTVEGENITHNAKAEGYEPGTEITIRIEAKEGYELVTIDGEPVEHEGDTWAEVTFTITEDTTITVVTKASEPAGEETDTHNYAVTDIAAGDPKYVKAKAGVTNTATFTGATAGSWYYLSFGTRNYVQKAGADGTVSITYSVPAGNTAPVRLYVTEAAPLVPIEDPVPAAAGFIYTDENGVMDMFFESIQGAAAVSTMFMGRAASVVTYHLTGKGVDVYFTVDPVTSKIVMFQSDRANVLKAAWDARPNGIEEGKMPLDNTAEDLKGEMKAESKLEANAGMLDTITLDVAPKVPGVPLPQNVTLTGGAVASMKWYLADENGEPTGEALADNYVAKADEKYVYTANVTADSDNTLAKKVTVNGTEVTITSSKGGVNISTDKTTVTPADEPENTNVFAKVDIYRGTTRSFPAKFEEYLPNGKDGDTTDALTQKEVADALTRESDKLDGVTFKPEDVDLTAGTATGTKADGTTVKVSFAKNVKSTRVFKVTYPSADGTATVFKTDANAVLESVNPNVKYLINKNTVAGTNAYAVDEEKLTATVTEAIAKDTDFVQAMKIVTPATITNGKISATVGGSQVAAIIAQVANKADNNNLVNLTNTGSNTYIQARETITIGLDGNAALTDSDSFAVKLNGSSTAAATISKANKTATITVPARTDGELKIVVEKSVAASNAKVFLDEKEITSKELLFVKDNVQYVKLTGLNGYTVVYKDENGDYLPVSGITGIGVDGSVTVPVSTTFNNKGMSADGSKVEIYLAYSVASSNSGAPAGTENWVGYLKLKANGKVNEETATSTTAKYVPANLGAEARTIYLLSKKGVLLCDDSVTTKRVALEGAKEYTNGKGIKDTQFIYTYEVKGNIAAGKFAPLVTFSSDSLTASLAGAIFEKDEEYTTSAAIGGVSLDDNADTTMLGLGTAASITAADPTKATLTTGENKLTAAEVSLAYKSAPGIVLKIAPTKEVRASTADSEVYQVMTSIAGIQVPVDVTVAKRTETDAEKIASAKKLITEALAAGIDDTKSPKDEADLKTAVANAVNDAITTGYRGIVDDASNTSGTGYTWGEITPAQTGTQAKPNGTDGVVNVTINLKSNDVTDTLTLAVPVNAYGYEVDLTLPTGYKYNYAGLVSEGTANSSPIAIPYNKEVTVTVPASVTDYYILKPGTTNEFVTGNGTFTVTMDEAKDLSTIDSDKYSTVAVTEAVGASSGYTNNTAVSVKASAKTYTADSKVEGKDGKIYVKQGSEVTVAFAVTAEDAANTETDAALCAKLVATNAGGSTGTGVQLLGASEKVNTYSEKTIAVTVGSGAKNITLAFELAATAA